MACPPIHVWIPNHPQATKARSTAGMLAPRTPNDARTNTGNGIPYLAPACAFSTMGTSTIRLPNRMVAIACHQFMPPAMRPEASMYVGTHTAIEIQSEAKLYVPQVRFSGGIGARSSL